MVRKLATLSLGALALAACGDAPTAPRNPLDGAVFTPAPPSLNHVPGTNLTQHVVGVQLFETPTNNVRVIWHEDPGATRYHVKLCATADCSVELENVASIPGTAWSMAGHLYRDFTVAVPGTQTTYYVRVNSQGNGSDAPYKDVTSATFSLGATVVNLPPTAGFDVVTAAPVEGSPVSFDAGDSDDPEDGPLTYAWDFGDGSAAGSGVSPTHSYADDGSYTVTLTVTDDQGLTSSDIHTVTVANVAPTATVSAPASVEEGSSITFGLLEPQDVSPVDAAAGFTYAFDCTGTGASYAAPGSSSSVSCSTDDNGTRTIKGKVIDKDGGATEYSASVNVSNVAPTASGITAPDAVNEGEDIAFSITGVTDPSSVDAAAGFAYAFACGAGPFGAWTSTNAGSCPAPDGPATLVVRARARDKDGGESAEVSVGVQVENVAPTVTLAGLPVDPVGVGSLAAAVTGTVTFTDPGTGDTHTATVNWGDGGGPQALAGDQSSPFTIGHTYGAAGIYTVTVTVTDDDGGAGTALHQYVVVYDPSAGFVTGGGWIDSPAGAYVADHSLAGKANFGFVSRYQKGATIPTGNTEFQFHAGSLSFRSTSYEWLVISGAKAQYKGEGTIAGDPRTFQFLLSAVDGQVSGGGGVDRFRIKIWVKGDDGAVVYDNQAGAALDAEATMEIKGGSIVIHSGGNGRK